MRNLAVGKSACVRKKHQTKLCLQVGKEEWRGMHGLEKKYNLIIGLSLLHIFTLPHIECNGNYGNHMTLDSRLEDSKQN